MEEHKQDKQVIISSKKSDHSWCSDRLRTLFSDTFTEEFTTQVVQIVRTRRVLDFAIEPGRVTAKVHDEVSRSNRVQIFFKQLSDSEWDGVFEALATRAYFLAMMLSGKIPLEMEQIFSTCGAELFPSSLGQIFISVNRQQNAPVCKNVGAVLWRLFEKVEGDPFLIFVLRGRGREETILELRKRRSLLKKAQDLSPSLSEHRVNYEPAPPLVTTVDYFWTAGSALTELSYTIRADELPASVLKWLDPPPLGGLENQVDFLLEEAYEKVTRLAQGFGLRL